MTSPGPIPEAGWPELRDARETERLGSYLRAVWARRDYMWYVARAEVRSAQIDSLLGNLWHLINPALQIGVFYVIFGVVLQVDRGVGNFLAFLAVGIFVFQYTQKAVSTGARALIKYRGLMQMVNFPRAVLPITSTLFEMLTALPTFIVLYITALATGEPPRWSWLLVLPVFALLTVLNVGLAMVAARATGHIPDVLQVLPIIFRLGFYGSGVLFSVDAYLDDPAARLLFELNPLYCFIEITRSLVLDDYSVDTKLFIIASVWSVAAAVVGFLFFRAGEDSYGNA